jgi:hypothetical protein
VEQLEVAAERLSHRIAALLGKPAGFHVSG